MITRKKTKNCVAGVLNTVNTAYRSNPSATFLFPGTDLTAILHSRAVCYYASTQAYLCNSAFTCYTICAVISTNDLSLKVKIHHPPWLFFTTRPRVTLANKTLKLVSPSCYSSTGMSLQSPLKLSVSYLC